MVELENKGREKQLNCAVSLINVLIRLITLKGVLKPKQLGKKSSKEYRGDIT